MSNWVVRVMRQTIGVNNQLNFYESPQIKGYPSRLKSGDTLRFEFVPNGTAKGMVISAEETEAHIEVNGEQWGIRRPTASDFISPSSGGMKPEIWFTRDRL